MRSKKRIGSLALTLMRRFMPILLRLPLVYGHRNRRVHPVPTCSGNGPLTGHSATGAFTYDSSSIIPGIDNIANGLFTALNFAWNGITYDQTTANTGFLGSTLLEI